MNTNDQSSGLVEHKLEFPAELADELEKAAAAEGVSVEEYASALLSVAASLRYGNSFCTGGVTR